MINPETLAILGAMAWRKKLRYVLRNLTPGYYICVASVTRFSQDTVRMVGYDS